MGDYWKEERYAVQIPGACLQEEKCLGNRPEKEGGTKGLPVKSFIFSNPIEPLINIKEPKYRLL